MKNAKSTKKVTHVTSDTTDTTDTSTTNPTLQAPASPATSGAAVAAGGPPQPLGAGIPSEEDVAKWTLLLDGVTAMLGDAATPLTTQERRRALRSRKGGETIVGLMAALGSQYNVQLPGVDPKAMQQNLLIAKRLQPLETKLRAVSGIVSDTVGHARTESWQGTTALYTALARASARAPSLQKELEPAIAFFSTGKRTLANGQPKPPKNPPRKKKGAAAVTAAEAAGAVAHPAPAEVAPEPAAAPAAAAAK